MWTLAYLNLKPIAIRFYGTKKLYEGTTLADLGIGNGQWVDEANGIFTQPEYNGKYIKLSQSELDKLGKNTDEWGNTFTSFVPDVAYVNEANTAAFIKTQGKWYFFSEYFWSQVINNVFYESFDVMMTDYNQIDDEDYECPSEVPAWDSMGACTVNSVSIEKL